MKLYAIALPIILATASGLPAQAHGISFSNGNVTVQLSSSHNGYGHKEMYREDRRWNNEHRYYTQLSPRDIARKLRSRGYSDVGAMQIRGNVYTVTATSDRGIPVRLTVNARNGDIMTRQVLRTERRYNQDRHARWNDQRNGNTYRPPFWQR